MDMGDPVVMCGRHGHDNELRRSARRVASRREATHLLGGGRGLGFCDYGRDSGVVGGAGAGGAGAEVGVEAIARPEEEDGVLDKAEEEGDQRGVELIAMKGIAAGPSVRHEGK